MVLNTYALFYFFNDCFLGVTYDFVKNSALSRLQVQRILTTDLFLIGDYKLVMFSQ